MTPQYENIETCYAVTEWFHHLDQPNEDPSHALEVDTLVTVEHEHLR